MCTTYFLGGAFLFLVVLGPLVVVLVIDGPLLVLWRNHAKSAIVPVVMLPFCVVTWLFWYASFTVRVRILLVHLVPCLPDVLSRPGFRKKSSLMSPPR